MANRLVPFLENEYYHIYNRGVDKRKTFMNPAEYKRFIRSLVLLNDTAPIAQTHALRSDIFTRVKLSKEITKKRTETRGRPVLHPLDKKRDPLVAIGAFALMPNHFHLYLTPLVDGGISKMMHRLQTSYTLYFNERHERSGALFQGTFKARHVDSESYARYLFSYIHLNSTKLVDPKWKEFGVKDFKRVRDFVRAYPYSSLPEYLSGKHVITDPSKFPDFLSTMRDVDEHIDMWLQTSPGENENYF